MLSHRRRRRPLVLPALVAAVAGLLVPAPVTAHAADPSDGADWLTVVNHHREGSGLDPVGVDSRWDRGIEEHLRYLARTPAAQRTGSFGSSHTQNPASRWATSAGADAAASSNIGGGSTDRASIEGWLTAPFHAIGLLRPGWRTTAFGRDPETRRAMLDVVRGLDPAPPAVVLFPGDGATTDLRSYDGRESPDPLDSCPGFVAPTGLPIIAMLPEAPTVGTTAAVTLPDGSTVSEGPDLCVITADTYRSDDPLHGATGRTILEVDDAVIIIPRRPLTDGRHTVQLAVPGVIAPRWSFTVAEERAGGSGADQDVVGAGYLLVDDTGRVSAFGGAPSSGSALSEVVASDVAASPSGRGHWVLRVDGAIEARGDATPFPALPALRPGERATALTTTASGGGLWVFTSLGRALTLGDAPFFGDMDGTVLNGPVLDGVVTPSGRGYYLVGSDGGVFAFGDATFAGSMGGRPLNAPVLSLAPDPDGRGYWLVADDGGVFAFEAEFGGSMGGRPLNAPIVGIVTRGDAYTLVGADGGVFSFGAPFFGGLGGDGSDRPIVAITPVG